MKLTIIITGSSSKYIAICTEFELSETGETKDEALKNLVAMLAPMFTTWATHLRKDPQNIHQLADVQEFCTI